MLFKIKLQTKAGNDVKNKQSFNVVFMTRFKQNSITQKITGQYTFKIIYSNNVIDYKKVLTIKDSDNLISKFDLVAKVMVNLLILVNDICKKENINPDLVMFNSTNFAISNNLYRVLMAVTEGNSPSGRQVKALDLPPNYEILELLKKLCVSQQDTRFMCIEPSSSRLKYAKSLEICNTLAMRFANSTDE